MIKRYDFEEGHRGYPCAVECDDGGYVDYDDHAAEIARLQARVQELDIKRNDAVDLWLDAESRIHTAWNDAIEAAAHLIECDGDAMKGKADAARCIRALKRPTSEVSNG